jgi:tetratricopeptide (TPR) repeat protein
MRTPAKFLLLSIWSLIVFSGLTSATTIDSYRFNREGIQKMKDKAYFPAFQSFMKAIESDPLNPELQLNLGLTFEANEEWEKAEAAYTGALKIIPENSPRRFEALFNLARVLGQQQRIPEALSVYQQALDLYPESKEVKTNIELLWQNGGGGKGDGKNNDKNKDKNDQQNQDKKDGDKDEKEQKKPSDPNQEKQNQQKKPRPFNSDQLTPEDVKKIMDELKNQEQNIRAKEYERGAKDAPHGKDW